MANELQTKLDAILLDKNTNLLPENLKAGVNCLGVNGTYEGSSGNVISMLYASVIEYFINNYGMSLNDVNQSAYFSSIVNKRNGETLTINSEHDFFPQNVYSIKIKSYDSTTGKVEYELPSTININNNMSRIYLPTTWQIGDKLDFYVNLYVEYGDMKSISLPLSFIFKDIELVYTPSIDNAEYIQLTGNQIMTVTSNYSVGDNITISPVNMYSSWEIGQTMRVSGITSSSYIKENDTTIEMPTIYNYGATIPTPFLVGTITNIDTNNKKVTLSITELNTLYTEYINTLEVDADVYTNKDRWLPSFSTNVSNNTNNRILLQQCSVDEVPNRRTQSYYYDDDNPGKTITRTNTYTDNVTAIRNSTAKFSTFTPAS